MDIEVKSAILNIAAGRLNAMREHKLARKVRLARLYQGTYRVDGLSPYEHRLLTDVVNDSIVRWF